MGDLNNMKKAIYAVLFHVCSSEKDNYHAHCPTGVDSWCTYQLDIANKTKLHKPTKGLPEETIKHLKPIFERLSDSLLIVSSREDTISKRKFYWVNLEANSKGSFC